MGETQLNTAGYWLLRRGRVDDAIAVFRVNVEMFPDAFNPYDSLGEAYLARGDTAQAITNYTRSVDLNPGNTGGIEVLRRLGVRQQTGTTGDGRDGRMPPTFLA